MLNNIQAPNEENLRSGRPELRFEFPFQRPSNSIRIANPSRQAECRPNSSYRPIPRLCEEVVRLNHKLPQGVPSDAPPTVAEPRRAQHMLLHSWRLCGLLVVGNPGP